MTASLNGGSVRVLWDADDTAEVTITGSGSAVWTVNGATVTFPYTLSSSTTFETTHAGSYDVSVVHHGYEVASTPDGTRSVELRFGEQAIFSPTPDGTPNNKFMSDLHGSLSATIDTAVTARTTAIDMPLWRAAREAVVAGTSDAKILCIGDSTTIGAGTLTGTPDSYPYLIASQLATEGVPSARGLAVGPRAIGPDVRWSVGAGWTEEAFGWAANSSMKGAVGSSALTFTDTTLADRYDVYYWTANGAGSVTAQATGGSAVTQDTHSLSVNIQKFTVSAGSAATTNVLTITNASAAEVHIVSVEPWHSTVKRVRVANAGVAGATTTAWVDPKSGAGSPNCIRAYAPDLTIINLGINDAFTPLAVETYLANIQTLIDVASETGDVLIHLPVPIMSTADATRLANEPLYGDALIAEIPDWNVLDLWGDGGWGRPGEDAVPTYMLDALHPNATGNAALATFIRPTLLSNTVRVASAASVAEQVAARAGQADVQIFTASGTWTKPSGAKSVQIMLVGPGGGGGAGARGASGVALTGGAGGGGGGVVFATMPASALAASVTVTVPAGGAGGVAQTTDSTAGANGASPTGGTVFGQIAAQRGLGGAGGTITGSSAVAGTGGTGILAGGSGGAASAGNNGNAAAAPAGAPGGGGGGGVATTPAARAGGNGGSSTIYVGTGGTGGAIDNAGNPGSALTLVSNGGGGGGSSITSTGKAGGAGGSYGAGGGGGGASLNGNASGAGGAGGGGVCVVTTYF